MLLFTADFRLNEQLLGAFGLKSGQGLYGVAGFGLTLVEVGLIILLTMLGARFARHLSRSASRNALWDAQLVLLVGRLVYIAVVVLGFLALLEVLAPGLFTPVIGAVGLLGLAFGLAFQDILKNWISGFFLLLERPFRIGDEITVNGQTGFVETVLLRVTVLRTSDGRRVLVPNQQVFTSTIIDSSTYPSRQYTALTGLPPERPMAAAMREAAEAVKGVAGVASTPEPEVSLVPSLEFGAALEVRFWVDVTEQPARPVQRRVNAALMAVAAGQKIRLGDVGLGSEGADEGGAARGSRADGRAR
ncbi:MAG: mechanosensitive ion channel family protein [Candidatus Dormibacteria bacterium]